MSRIGKVVSVLCHLAKLGISEGQPQKPMCPCLERMPTRGLHMWFTFTSLRVNQQRGKGEQRLWTSKPPHSRVPFPPGSQSHTLSALSPFGFMHLPLPSVQHIWMYSTDLQHPASVTPQHGDMTLSLTLRLASVSLSICRRLHLLQEKSYGVMTICINS